MNEIFNAVVKKYDDEHEERFNRYLNELIECFDKLVKIRDDLKQYLVENSDKFEYDPETKTISYRPSHHFTMNHDVLTDMVLTVFASDGICGYAKGDISSCEEIDKRLKKEYESRHPDWFHLEGGSLQKAVFKYPDDGMIVKLNVSCLDVTEIIMEQI